MKAYEKRKSYRLSLRKLRLAGMINAADGRMIPKNQIPDSSMRRDYFPNGGER